MISVNRDHNAVISQTCSVFEMLTHWFSLGKGIIYTRGNIRNNILVLWPHKHFGRFLTVQILSVWLCSAHHNCSVVKNIEPQTALYEERSRKFFVINYLCTRMARCSK